MACGKPCSSGYGGHGGDGAGNRIDRSDPGQPEVAELDGNPADALEDLFRRPGPSDGLVHLAENDVEVIEPHDFGFAGFAFGDVGDYRAAFAPPPRKA